MIKKQILFLSIFIIVNACKKAPPQPIESLNPVPQQTDTSDTTSTDPEQTETSDTSSTEPEQTETSDTSSTEPEQTETSDTSSTEPEQTETSDTSSTEPEQTGSSDTKSTPPQISSKLDTEIEDRIKQLYVENYERGISCFQNLSDDTDLNINRSPEYCLTLVSQTKIPFINYISSDKKDLFSPVFIKLNQCQPYQMECFTSSYKNIIDTCDQEKETLEQSKITGRICSLFTVLLDCIENSADQPSLSQCINSHAVRVSGLVPFVLKEKYKKINIVFNQLYSNTCHGKSVCFIEKLKQLINILNSSESTETQVSHPDQNVQNPQNKNPMCAIYEDTIECINRSGSEELQKCRSELSEKRISSRILLPNEVQSRLDYISYHLLPSCQDNTSCVHKELNRALNILECEKESELPLGSFEEIIQSISEQNNLDDEKNKICNTNAQTIACFKSDSNDKFEKCKKNLEDSMIDILSNVPEDNKKRLSIHGKIYFRQ